MDMFAVIPLNIGIVIFIFGDLDQKGLQIGTNTHNSFPLKVEDVRFHISCSISAMRLFLGKIKHPSTITIIGIQMLNIPNRSFK